MRMARVTCSHGSCGGLNFKRQTLNTKLQKRAEAASHLKFSVCSWKFEVKPGAAATRLATYGLPRITAEIT
jgi:hypothetical protein